MGKGGKGKKKGSNGRGDQYKLKPISAERAFDPKQSRIRALNTQDDVYGGDEDQFHKNRDSILFEDDGRNQADSDSDLDVGDEIYGLDLPSSDQQDDEDDDDGADLEEEEEEEEDVAEPVRGKGRKNKTATAKVEEPRGRFAKAAQDDDDIYDSDEEQTDHDDDDDADVVAPALDSDNDEDKSAAGDSDDEEERWAAGQYHVSRRAPGEADSSDDEALELEAEEARRLQRRMRDTLAGEDFGLAEDDDDDAESGSDAGAKTTGSGFSKRKGRRAARIEDEEDVVGQGIAVKPLETASTQTAQNLSEEEAIAQLLKRSPETLALLDDFAATAERVRAVERNLAELREAGDPEHEGKEHPALAIMELEHQALVTYLPTLAFYFSLLLAPTPNDNLIKRVLDRLATLRQALATMEDLDLTSEQYEAAQEDDDEEEEEDGMLASDVWDAAGTQGAFVDGQSDSDDEDDDEEGSAESSIDEDEDMQDLMRADGDSDEDDDEDEDGQDESMLDGLTDEDLESLMKSMPKRATAEDFIAAAEALQREKKGLPPVGANMAADGDDDYEMNDIVEGGNNLDDMSAAAKKQRKRDKKEQKKKVVVPDLAPLSSSALRKASKASTSSAKKSASGGDDYLEPTSLSYADTADKSSARKSLRFHVSQVNQKQARREAGHGRRLGGDDDLPRRSKENARREVLKRQQHGGVAPGSAGEALDPNEDFTAEDMRVARGVKGLDRDGDAGDDSADADEYYDMVKRGREEGRAAKKARYDDERMEERNELMDMASEMADGPRGANRKILANKGLTPKRAKVNRNPRVKKRMAYDKAVKKVSTMKSVYKGGDGGNYEGEKSGIGKRTVKSVRLG